LSRENGGRSKVFASNQFEVIALPLKLLLD
jgi:hypothetical protein